MSKPKNNKSRSKSKKRTPARKIKPKCKKCNCILRLYAEIDYGYCTSCLTTKRSLDPMDTLLEELRSKRGETLASIQRRLGKVLLSVE